MVKDLSKLPSSSPQKAEPDKRSVLPLVIAGALIGSFFGPVAGTIIGAVAGGAVGVAAKDKEEKKGQG